MEIEAQEEYNSDMIQGLMNDVSNDLNSADALWNGRPTEYFEKVEHNN
jgi:archaellum component FlaC